MNKFDTLVNSILAEGLMGSIARAAGKAVGKAVNPAAYMRGAANVSRAIDTAHNYMKSGDLTSTFSSAANVLSKTGQAAKSAVTGFKGSGNIPGLSSNIKTKTGATGTMGTGNILFNINAMQNAASKPNPPFTFPRGISTPARLKVGDTFTQINRKTGQSQAFKVIDIARDRSNIVAAPVEFYK